jgi:UDP-MurNAc hydroxylase
MAYLEASLAPRRRATTRRLTDADKAEPGATWRCGNYLVERRCPHLGGDLARFGEVQHGILTCTLHGWRFDLASGRCLTADRAGLGTEWVGDGPPPGAGSPPGDGS